MTEADIPPRTLYTGDEMNKWRDADRNESEELIAAALAAFGWTCGPEFWERYYSDAWVFNLANAVVALSEQVNETGARGDD